MASLKELSKRQELLSPGHRACVGCGAALAIRQVLLAAQKVPVVASCGVPGDLHLHLSLFGLADPLVPQCLRELRGHGLRDGGGLSGLEADR